MRRNVAKRVGAALLACGLGFSLGISAASAEDRSDGGGFLGTPDELDGRWASPKPVGNRVCPTKNFWVGDGWGADRGRRKHTGIDLAADRGTPIFAVEDGRIDRTKLQSNGALQIVMKGKSGSKYYYGHMDDVFISGGDKVVAGQVIATMGDSGSPGSVHLHFEYWRSGGESAAINPKRLINRICR